MEGLLVLKLLDAVIDVLESLASRATVTRQFKPQNPERQRQESCDSNTKYDAGIKPQASRAAEI